MKGDNITQELKTKVLARVRDQLEKRDGYKAKVDRLELAITQKEARIEDLHQKMLNLNKEVADLIGEGADPTKKAAKLQRLRGEVEEIKGLVEQIKVETLPEARDKLKESSGDLGAIVKAMIIEEQKAYVGKMESHAKGFMAVYDSIVEGQRAVFNEIKLPSMAGTFELAPRIKMPELVRYIQNVGVGSLEKP